MDFHEVRPSTPKRNQFPSMRLRGLDKGRGRDPFVLNLPSLLLVDSVGLIHIPFSFLIGQWPLFGDFLLSGSVGI